VPVGAVGEDVSALLRVTQEALEKGIAQVTAAAGISDIGHAIQAHVEAHGFSVVREFVGHGIGASLPRGAADRQLRRAGPRAAAGRRDDAGDRAHGDMGKAAVKVLADGWTAVTKDGSLSAHFEHNGPPSRRTGRSC